MVFKEDMLRSFLFGVEQNMVSHKSGHVEMLWKNEIVHSDSLMQQKTGYMVGRSTTEIFRSLFQEEHWVPETWVFFSVINKILFVLCSHTANLIRNLCWKYTFQFSVRLLYGEMTLSVESQVGISDDVRDSKGAALFVLSIWDHCLV